MHSTLAGGKKRAHPGARKTINTVFSVKQEMFLCAHEASESVTQPPSSGGRRTAALHEVQRRRVSPCCTLVTVTCTASRFLLYIRPFQHVLENIASVNSFFFLFFFLKKEERKLD